MNFIIRYLSSNMQMCGPIICTLNEMDAGIISRRVLGRLVIIDGEQITKYNHVELKNLKISHSHA